MTESVLLQSYVVLKDADPQKVLSIDSSEELCASWAERVSSFPFIVGNEVKT